MIHKCCAHACPLTHPYPATPTPLQESWVPVLKATDIAPGDIIPVESNGQQLLLVADYDGSVYWCVPLPFVLPLC